MPINISKIVGKTQEITNDSVGGPTELELSRVAEVGNIIEDSSVYSVPTTSNLPTAANNTGRFVYVDDKCRYYYSNGTSWTDDYVTTNLTSLQIWMFGCNANGQLGLNDIINYSTPTQEACGGTNWCSINEGCVHVSSIKTDSTLWSWGYNYSGNLGTNNTTSYSTPTQEACGGTNWCMVSTGGSHNSSIKTDGTLWSWGSGGFGRLGTNDTINYSTPTQEACGGTNWCKVSSGVIHTSAIKSDGTLWSWGRGAQGRLGINSTSNQSTPQQEACNGTNWCKVSAGNNHASAIKTDGTLWSWGSNAYGKLGTNDTTLYSTPTQEACGGTTWCNVSTGIGSTSAIKTDGTLWSWGINTGGQLGINDLTFNCYSTPQQEVCGGTNWCMVSIHRIKNHVLAIKTDGTLWGWGCNPQGQLGTNNTITYSTPQQEACGFTDWTQPFLRGTLDTSGFFN